MRRKSETNPTSTSNSTMFLAPQRRRNSRESNSNSNSTMMTEKKKMLMVGNRHASVVSLSSLPVHEAKEEQVDERRSSVGSEWTHAILPSPLPSDDVAKLKEHLMRLSSEVHVLRTQQAEDPAGFSQDATTRIKTYAQQLAHELNQLQKKHEAEVNFFNTEKNALVAEKQELQMQCQRLKYDQETQKKAYETSMEIHEKRYETSQTSNVLLRKQSLEDQAKIKELELQVQQLQRESFASEVKFDSQQTRYQTSSEGKDLEISRLEKKNEEVLNRAQRAEEQNTQCNYDMQDMKQQIEALQKHAEKVIHAKQVVDSQLDQVQVQSKQQQEHMKVLQHDCTSLVKQVVSLKCQLSYMEKRVGDAQLELESAREKLKQSREETFQTRNDKEALQYQLDKAEAEKVQALAQFPTKNQTSKMLEQLRHDLLVVEKQLQNKTLEVDKLSEERGTQKSENAGLVASKAILQDKHDILVQELQDIRKQMYKMQMQNDTLVEQLQESKGQLAKSNDLALLQNKLVDFKRLIESNREATSSFDAIVQKLAPTS